MSVRAPRFARCCVDHRIAVIDHIVVAVANDAAETLCDLVDDGWAPAVAARAVHVVYREWLLSQLDEAITFGIEFAHTAEAPAL